MSTLEEYLEFAKTHPEFFQNPDSKGLQILLEPEDIRRVENITADRLNMEGLPTAWATVGIVFQDAYGLILRDAVSFPGGSIGTHSRFIGAGRGIPGAAVLPVHHGNVLLLRHFRHATRLWHLEIPRGLGTLGFTPEDVARTELVEEMNSEAERLIALGDVHPDTGASPWRVRLFYAEVGSYGAVEHTAGISGVLEVGLPEFERLIRDNEITDDFTIASFARARLLGLI